MYKFLLPPSHTFTYAWPLPDSSSFSHSRIVLPCPYLMCSAPLKDTAPLSVTSYLVTACAPHSSLPSLHLSSLKGGAPLSDPSSSVITLRQSYYLIFPVSQNSLRAFKTWTELSQKPSKSAGPIQNAAKHWDDVRRYFALQQSYL